MTRQRELPAALPSAKKTVRIISVCASSRLLREEIRRSMPTPGNMKCLFMRVLAKFTVMVSGILSNPEMLFLCRLMKSIKLKIPAVNY